MSKVTQLVHVQHAVFAVVDGGVSKWWVNTTDGVDHVKYRWGLQEPTEITEWQSMIALGPVTNADVPSNAHDGQTLLQLGWDGYGWKP